MLQSISFDFLADDRASHLRLCATASGALPPAAMEVRKAMLEARKAEHARMRETLERATYTQVIRAIRSLERWAPGRVALVFDAAIASTTRWGEDEKKCVGWRILIVLSMISENKLAELFELKDALGELKDGFWVRVSTPRISALEALGRLPPRHLTEIGKLIWIALRDGSTWVRLLSLKVLGKLPPKNLGENVKLIKKALGDYDTRVRVLALDVFEKLPPHKLAAHKNLLMKASEDVDYVVRRRALQVRIGSLGPNRVFQRQFGEGAADRGK